MPELITLAIALVGAFTGISGLLINLSNYLKSRARLNIQLSDDFNSFFVRVEKDDDTLRYQTEAFSIVNLEIINTSNNPVTITQILIKDKRLKFPLKHNSDFKIPNPFLSFETGEKTSVSYRVNNVLETPIRLDSFDFVQGSIRFPFFSTLAPDDQSDSKFTVIVCTSRRTHRLKVQISELSELHRIRYPQYTDTSE